MTLTPPTTHHSNLHRPPYSFKAPSPTNYDATLELLAADFSDVVATVAGYAASEVPNDIARDMYAKTLEPGFEYENAALFAEGGHNLMLRDLFNR